MVTYEITAVVRPDLQAAYEAFMRERHIPDLLATGAFTGASIASSAPGRYRIRYEARSREALDHYLSKDAPRSGSISWRPFRKESSSPAKSG